MTQQPRSFDVVFNTLKPKVYLQWRGDTIIPTNAVILEFHGEDADKKAFELMDALRAISPMTEYPNGI